MAVTCGAANAVSNTPTIAVPAGSTGDLLTAVMFILTSATVTPPAGYTLRLSNVNFGHVLTKTRVLGDTGANHTFTNSTGGDSVTSIMLLNLLGADTADPLSNTPETDFQNTAGPAVGPSVAADAAGGLLVFSHITDQNWSGVVSGMTQRATTTQPGGNDAETWTEELAAGGETGTRSHALASSGNWVTLMFVVNSAAGGATSFPPVGSQRRNVQRNPVYRMRPPQIEQGGRAYSFARAADQRLWHVAA